MNEVKRSKKILYVLGNILEFYEFTIYALFTPLFARLFFPTKYPFLSLLSSLAVFASAFFMRPLGSLFFGHIGDKWGRKISLIISLFTMALSTFTIGLLPTADKLGMFSGVSMLLCRCFQGFSAGGEYPGSSILLMESESKRKNLVGALIPMSCAIGALCAALTAFFLQNSLMPLWSWRVAFLFGGMLGIIALFLRLKTSESPEFEAHIRRHKLHEIKNHMPFKAVLKSHKKAFLITFLIGSYSYILINFSFVYLNIFLNQILEFTMRDSIFFNLFGIISFILSTILFGYLGDKFKHQKIMNIINILILFFIIIVFSLMLTKQNYALIISEVLICFLTGAYAACTNGYMYTLFPINIRFTGIALGYSLGMAIFGGTTPLICSLLLEFLDNNLTPAYYICFMSFITYLFLRHCQ